MMTENHALHNWSRWKLQTTDDSDALAQDGVRTYSRICSECMSQLIAIKDEQSGTMAITLVPECPSLAKGETP